MLVYFSKIPIFLVDLVEKVFGLIHAGWRGVVDGIIQQGIYSTIQIGSVAAPLIFAGVVETAGLTAVFFVTAGAALASVGLPLLIATDGRPTRSDRPKNLLRETYVCMTVAAMTTSKIKLMTYATNSSFPGSAEQGVHADASFPLEAHHVTTDGRSPGLVLNVPRGLHDCAAPPHPTYHSPPAP